MTDRCRLPRDRRPQIHRSMFVARLAPPMTPMSRRPGRRCPDRQATHGPLRFGGVPAQVVPDNQGGVTRGFMILNGGTYAEHGLSLAPPIRACRPRKPKFQSQSRASLILLAERWIWWDRQRNRPVLPGVDELNAAIRPLSENVNGKGSPSERRRRDLFKRLGQACSETAR